MYNDALIASQFGGKKCEPCPVATYSPTGNTCLPCVASNGYVNDITRAAVCNYCGPGRRADVTTNTCQLCVVNEYSVGGSDTCSDCAGRHSDPGSSSCINGPGEHSEEDASFCEKCPQYELYNKETDECECQDTFTRVEGVCTCTAGLTLIGETCSACEIGRFKEDHKALGGRPQALSDHVRELHRRQCLCLP